MAMKQTDLSDRLFEQLDALREKTLTGDKLYEEIARSKAVTEVATQIIANGALVANVCRMTSAAAHSIKLPVLLSDE